MLQKKQKKYAKGEVAIVFRVLSRWSKKIPLAGRNFEDHVRTGTSKTVDL